MHPPAHSDPTISHSFVSKQSLEAFEFETPGINICLKEAKKVNIGCEYTLNYIKQFTKINCHY